MDASTVIERARLCTRAGADRATHEGSRAELLAAGLVPVARDAEYVGQYNVLFVSGRWARHAAVRQALEEHAYRLEHEWSREPSRVRQSETLRGVLRPVRRGVSQIVGRARRG